MRRAGAPVGAAGWVRGASRRQPSQGPRRPRRRTCAVSPSTEGASPGRPRSTGAEQSGRRRPVRPQERRGLGPTGRRHPPRRWGWKEPCPGPAAERGMRAACASGLWLAPATETRAAVGARPGGPAPRPRWGAAAGPEARPGQGDGKRQHGGQAPGGKLAAQGRSWSVSILHTRPRRPSPPAAPTRPRSAQPQGQEGTAPPPGVARPVQTQRRRRRDPGSELLL